jgi:hypothetical protein
LLSCNVKVKIDFGFSVAFIFVKISLIQPLL